MTDVPQPDTNTAISWLKMWHPDGPWIIVEIDPATAPRRPPAHTFHDLDELEAYLLDRNGKVNLYFIPNRLKFDATVTTTPTKDQIGLLTCLQVDLDLPKTGPRAAQTPENIQWLRLRIEALFPAPTVIIFSGGGLQAYWLFDTPLEADQHRDKVEAASKEIALQLGSDAVQNINRLMRLPGTVNLPNVKKREAGRKPELARLLSADWGRTWSLLTDQVPRLVGDEEAPWTEDEEDHAHPGDDASASPPGFTTDRFHDLSSKWQKLVATGDTKGHGDDRSRLVMSFIATHLRKGWSEEDITAILINRKFKISDHIYSQGGSPEAVIRRQVGRIRHQVVDSWDMLSSGAKDPASPKNISRAIEELSVRLSYDAFASKIWVNGRGAPEELHDAITSTFRIEIYTRFGFLPRADVLNDVIVVK